MENTNVFSLRKLIGSPVISEEGEPLGIIKDFIIDVAGKVRLIIIQGQPWDSGGPKTFAVPFDCFQKGEDEEVFCFRETDFAPSTLSMLPILPSVYRYAVVYDLQKFLIYISYFRRLVKEEE